LEKKYIRRRHTYQVEIIQIFLVYSNRRGMGPFPICDITYVKEREKRRKKGVTKEGSEERGREGSGEEEGGEMRVS
jgi:hypothetical protein